MQNIELFLTQENIDEDLHKTFVELHETCSFFHHKETIIQYSYNQIGEDFIDYQELYDLMREDFDQSFSMLITESKAFNWLELSMILEYFETLPKGYYELEDFILFVIKKHPESIKTFQKKLLHCIDQSHIDTLLGIAKANMNLSIAAKKLYTHRNTLHYRLDKVIDLTGINVRSFKGLSIFTYLFYF